MLQHLLYWSNVKEESMEMSSNLTSQSEKSFKTKKPEEAGYIQQV